MSSPQSIDANPQSHLRLDVPAKINLFLHVTGRRADGYHLLESVFCPVNCYDRLTLSLRREPGVHLRGGVEGLAPEHDLSVKAAQAVLSLSAQTCGVNIDLTKQIPTGAGLGGGSADAAYTLMGVNELLGNPLRSEQLQQIALGLGADVPFFLFGQPAFVSGIGEVLQAIELAPLSVALVKPPAHLATARVFSHPDLTRNCPAVKMSVFGFSDAADTLAFVARHTQNVLQPIAEMLSPDVSQALSLFQQAPAHCRPLWYRMTGSGSAVFGVFVSDEQTQYFVEWASRQISSETHADDTCAPHGWFVWHGQTLNRSRLKDQMVQAP